MFRQFARTPFVLQQISARPALLRPFGQLGSSAFSRPTAFAGPSLAATWQPQRTVTNRKRRARRMRRRQLAMDALTPEERAALKQERTNKWETVRRYKSISMTLQARQAKLHRIIQKRGLDKKKTPESGDVAPAAEAAPAA